MDSHHHRHHKAAVLAGVELRLALLTTMIAANADMSLSNIYPDKHDTLQIAGQIHRGDKMRVLKAILDEDLKSGIARREKKSQGTTNGIHCSS
jgi:hypothetical protein